MSDSNIAAQSDRSYVLGHSDRKLARLQVQARLIDPITRGFMRDSGIVPGVRVARDPNLRRSGMKFPPFVEMFLVALTKHLS